jgi:hypothetical protein
VTAEIIDISEALIREQIERIAPHLAREYFDEPWPTENPAMDKAVRKRCRELALASRGLPMNG